METASSLATAKRSVVGRSEVRFDDGVMFPVLGLFSYLFDAQRPVLPTKRFRTSRLWPGSWSNSCSGHLFPDEPVEPVVPRWLAAGLRSEPSAIVLVLQPEFVMLG